MMLHINGTFGRRGLCHVAQGSLELGAIGATLAPSPSAW